jgi:hypothetical protein
LCLNKTKLKPKDAAAPIPHKVPTKTLPSGALRTSSPLATETPTPIRAKHAVIQVALDVFSPSISVENIEANIGDVAKVNNIRDAEVSAIPYVKKNELIIWQQIILKPIGDSIFLKFILKTLKQLENIIKMIPISIPLQVSIDQTSISDHLMKRTSGDKINAPILAIPIPLKRFPDKEKFKILPKYYYY